MTALQLLRAFGHRRRRQLLVSNTRSFRATSQMVAPHRQMFGPDSRAPPALLNMGGPLLLLSGRPHPNQLAYLKKNFFFLLKRFHRSTHTRARARARTHTHTRTDDSDTRARALERKTEEGEEEEEEEEEEEKKPGKKEKCHKRKVLSSTPRSAALLYHGGFAATSRAGHKDHPMSTAAVFLGCVVCDGSLRRSATLRSFCHRKDGKSLFQR